MSAERMEILSDMLHRWYWTTAADGQIVFDSPEPRLTLPSPGMRKTRAGGLFVLNSAAPAMTALIAGMGLTDGGAFASRLDLMSYAISQSASLAFGNSRHLKNQANRKVRGHIVD